MFQNNLHQQNSTFQYIFDDVPLFLVMMLSISADGLGIAHEKKTRVERD
jgi:hypothetical protein